MPIKEPSSRLATRDFKSLPPAPSAEQLREVFPPRVVGEIVDAFYGSVRRDPMIGPIFESRVQDWDTHLQRMKLFWGTILRAEPGFTASDRGSPPRLHKLIDDLALSHFDRWLELFETACRHRLHPSAAEHLLARARRIGLVLSAHLQPAESEC